MDVIKLALKQRVLIDIIDIGEQAAGIEASELFLKANAPSEDCSVKADSLASPISSIWQTLFSKQNQDLPPCPHQGSESYRFEADIFAA